MPEAGKRFDILTRVVQFQCRVPGHGSSLTSDTPCALLVVRAAVRPLGGVLFDVAEQLIHHHRHRTHND